MFEKYRDSIKRVATLAKIQNVKEASHHPIFKDNWETFSLMFFVFVLLLWPDFKMRIERITS